jgi:hypothetical protein
MSADADEIHISSSLFSGWTSIRGQGGESCCCALAFVHCDDHIFSFVLVALAFLLFN